MPPPSRQIEGREIDEVRVRKRDGFFGVTLPVNASVPGALAQTAANYLAPFFVAQRGYRVVEVRERHEVAGSDAGAVTVDVNKVPDGTAPGSGTSVLSSAFSLKATANTLQTATLSSTLANLILRDGDALALESSGTLTAVVGVTVTVLLQAI